MLIKIYFVYTKNKNKIFCLLLSIF